MSMPGFLELKGKNQGPIEGSCEKKGFEKTIEVLTLHHDVQIPKNHQTGLYTGVRVHSPLIIDKEIDQSTPKLYQALCTGEIIERAIFSWYRFVKAGEPEKFYTVQLENASIVSIQPWVNDRVLTNPSQSSVEGTNTNFPFGSESGQMPHLENISFTYEKIIWTWVPGGIETSDTWTTHA